MPLIAAGIYVANADRPYEAETSYYLNYYIVSALVSIKYILRGYSKDDDMPFENRCQYYHYHTDHLLYAIGQISNRLCIMPKDKGLKLERKKKDVVNYQFDEKEFPILSNRQARNTVEHISEYNQVIISECNGVGGFNVIDDETSIELQKLLIEHRNTHPYTLDLLQGKIYITRKGRELTICLDELKDELLALKNNVDSFRFLSAMSIK